MSLLWVCLKMGIPRGYPFKWAFKYILMGINDNNPVESGLPNVLTNPYLPYVTSLIFLADIK